MPAPYGRKAQLLQRPRNQLCQIIGILLTDRLRKLKQELQHPAIHAKRRLLEFLTGFMKLAKAREAHVQRGPEGLQAGQDFKVALEAGGGRRGFGPLRR